MNCDEEFKTRSFSVREEIDDERRDEDDDDAELIYSVSSRRVVE